MAAIMREWAEEYLKKRQRGYKQGPKNKSFKSYENHVNKFINYLSLPSINKCNEPDLVNLDDISSCIGYYRKRGDIKSINSMRSHLEIIRSFYDYLIAKGLREHNIINNPDYSILIKSLPEKYDLKKPEKRQWLSNEEIELILDALTSYVANNPYENYYDVNKYGKKDIVYNTILNIHIKLSILAIVSTNILWDIKISDFKDNFQVLYINGINICLPPCLSDDIINALEFATKTCGKYQENESFHNYLVGPLHREKFEQSNLNSKMLKFLILYDIFDKLTIQISESSFEMESFQKAIRRDMVFQGVDPILISQISGVDISSLQYLYEEKKKSNLYSQEMRDKNYNQELKKLTCFHFLLK